MNLASNIKVKLVAMISGITMSLNVSANCATLQFDQTIKESKNQLFMVSRIDNEIVSSVAHEIDRELINGMTYNLSPGLHSLDIAMLPYDTYKEIVVKGRLNKSSRAYSTNHRLRKRQELKKELAESVKTKDVAMYFEADTKYEIGLSENGEPVVLSKTHKICGPDAKVIGPNLVGKAKHVDLPVQHKEMLRSVMLNIAGSSKMNLTDELHYHSLKPNNNFGVLLDDEFDGQGNARVLSVYPNSIAYDLGLRSGDKIVSINDKGLSALSKDPIVAFKSGLESLTYFNDANFEIKRKGKDTSIRGRIIPKLVPQSVYAFSSSLDSSNLAMDSRLPVRLSEQYDTAIGELFAYFNPKYPSIDRLLISEELFTKNSLGLVGSLNEKKQLIINTVSHHSILNNAGLKPGDMLIAIGNSSNQVTSPKDISQYFAKLKTNDPFIIFIDRQGEKIRIKGKYQEQKTAHYTIMLDMASYRSGLIALERHSREYSKKSRYRDQSHTHYQPTIQSTLRYSARGWRASTSVHQ